MRCCAGSPRRATTCWPMTSHATPRPGCWSAGAGITAPRPRARSPRPMAMSRRSISPSNRTPEAWAEHVHGRVLPTGTVRTLAHGAITLLPGFAEGAWWVQDAAASLPAQLLRRRGRHDGLRSVRGARRQDRATGGARRRRHGGRPLAGAAFPLARKFHPAGAQGRNRRRRRAGMAAGSAIRRRAARRPLHLDRHHPPPSRRALAQIRGRSGGSDLVAAAPARPRRRTHQSRRHAGLLRLFARTGRRRAADRRACWRAIRA